MGKQESIGFVEICLRILNNDLKHFKFVVTFVLIPTINTIPYLWDAYKDFGLPGIFLLPFFFGVLFTFCYHKMAIAKSPFMLLLTATFMMWIILWNFTTGYKQSMYWVWMFFFFFVCTVSSGRTILTREKDDDSLDCDKSVLPLHSLIADEISEQDCGQQEVTGKSK